MVRAKECLLGLNAPILPTETDTSPLARYRRYAVMAEHATMIRPRVLLITLGLDIDIRQSLTHQLIDDFDDPIALRSGATTLIFGAGKIHPQRLIDTWLS